MRVCLWLLVVAHGTGCAGRPPYRFNAPLGLTFRREMAPVPLSPTVGYRHLGAPGYPLGMAPRDRSTQNAPFPSHSVSRKSRECVFLMFEIAFPRFPAHKPPSAWLIRGLGR
jgi:hypothetical protein